MEGPAPAGGDRALLSLMGLAARARKLVFGTDMARGAARDGSLAAALVASDASPTQSNKLVPLLQARGIPYAVCLNRADIGAAIGRGPVSAVGFTDPSFARRALELAGSPPQVQERGGEPY